MKETFKPFQDLVQTQQLLQQGLADLERSLRSLTLMAAQANAELTLHHRRIDLLNGRMARLEAALDPPNRAG